MPEFVDNDALWIQHKLKVEKTEPPTSGGGDGPAGEHPVMLLSELYRDAVYVFDDTSPDGVSYVCSVELEGRSFQGAGRTKKLAKLTTATTAVEALAAEGILGTRRTAVALAREARQAKRAEMAEKRKVIIEQRKAERQNRERKNPPAPKNAIMRLHDLGVKPTAYSLVAAGDGDGRSGFTVSVLVHGQMYVGSGMSKRRGKLEAAEGALRGIGEWTEKDDEVKAEIVAKDEKKLANVIAATTPAGEGKKKKRKKKANAEQQESSLDEDVNMQDNFDTDFYKGPTLASYGCVTKPHVIPDLQQPAQGSVDPQKGSIVLEVSDSGAACPQI